MSWWTRIAEAGVDASLPSREARHVRSLNSISVLFALFSLTYLIVFIAFGRDGVAAAIVDGMCMVSWAAIPWIDLRRHHDLARRMALVTSVAQVGLVGLIIGRDSMIHYFLLGVGFPFAIFPRGRRVELVLHVALLVSTFFAVELMAVEPWWPISDYKAAVIRASMKIALVAFLLIIAVNAYVSLMRADEELEDALAGTERLLANMVPEPIAARLKAGETTIADSVPAATILFADIVNFTRYSQDVSAGEVVRVLDDIFSRFDALLPKYGLEKIKTIGDAYMAAAGLQSDSPDHMARAAEMALAMQAIMQDELGARGLQVRIGLHSGPIVAGVIGRTKFAYDVWGETVNTASRMEALGAPGRIQVGRKLYDALQDRFEFEARGAHEVKGLGTLELFFLNGKRPDVREVEEEEAEEARTMLWKSAGRVSGIDW
ncbi:MAG: adenylate/guanylate cyclase domain-containing protein [Myxococcales bacterium]|nr:adenylate/guanylate cyclase domain-containing protein [Myxococcales bacterium]